MNKRSIPILIVGGILVLLGVAGYFAPTPTEATPSRLLMQNAGGRVVFTHQAHSTPGGAYGDNQCSLCHHELKIALLPPSPDEPPMVMRCTTCHGATDDPNFIVDHQQFYGKNGDETSCVACHHTSITGFSEGWNHEDHKTYVGDDCTACHHEYRYEYKPEKFMNIKPQKCANCHTAKANAMTPTTLKDAGHTKCEPCHTDLFEMKAQGCATCHGQKKTATEVAAGRDVSGAYLSCSTCHAPLPGSMDAFHTQCRTCHDKAGKGPGTEAPCAQCHTP